MSPKAQEKLSGTKFDTLRRIYDEVTVEDVRRELDAVGGVTRRN